MARVPKKDSMATGVTSGLPTTRNLKKIIAFGDSTTAPRGPLVVYADLLRAELAKRGQPAEVINSGVPGNNTEQARERFACDVLAPEPDAVILWFGLNDSAIDVYLNATAPRVAVETYETNLRFFVAQLKARDIYVILMTPNPMTWTDELRGYYARPPYKPLDPDGMNVTLGPYLDAVRRIARNQRVPLVDVNQAFRGFGKSSTGGMDALLLDGMHPNDAGQRLVAERLLPLLIAEAQD